MVSARAFVAVLLLSSVAVAAPIPAQRMGAPKLVATAATKQCGYTKPLPPLPAGCATAPTAANCVDLAYLAGTCGKQQIVQKEFCQKALMDDWCKGRAEEEMVFPLANPKKTPIHGMMVPNTPSLFIPPGSVGPGKQVPFTGLKTARPNATQPPASLTQQGSTALAHGFAGPSFTMTGAGMGTFMTATAAQWMGRTNNTRTAMSEMNRAFTSVPSNMPQAERVNDGLFNQFNPEATYTSNGTLINSCAEHTYQSYYDYLRFKYAAKSLGRNYRGIYALAVEPTSPVNLEKPLKQLGSGDLPAWGSPGIDHTQSIPRNIFFSQPSFKATDDQAIRAKQVAIQTRINQFTTNNTRSIKSSGTNRFALHTTLRNQLESRFALSDDGLAERQARQNRYGELLASREELAWQLACATAPMLCCSAPPTNTPNGLHALLMQIRGWSVINPDPTQFTGLGADVGPIDWYDSWLLAEQIGISTAVRAIKQSPTNIHGTIPAGASVGIKQKAIALKADLPPTQQGAPPVLGMGAGGGGGGSCESEWGRRKAALQAAMNNTVTQLNDLVMKEWDLGAAGCLASPVGGDLGNSCDWSYEKFSRFAMSFYDSRMQQTFDACNGATRGDIQNAKQISRQGNVYPCELRHDFTGDQHDLRYYVETVKMQGRRFTCEQRRAQDNLDTYLEANASLVAKIPTKGSGQTAKVGESSGDRFQIGDRDSFGARLEYATNWEMFGTNNQKFAGDNAWCSPAGSSTMSGKGEFFFFGKTIRVIDGSLSQNSAASGAFYSARAEYADVSTLGMKDFFPKKTNVRMTTPQVAQPFSFALLGEARADFWASIGPIPLHVFFGAQALAGIDLKATGSATSASSCATAGDVSKKSDSVPMNFSSGTQFEPFVRVDAFGDASLDVGVAAAGMHVDLLLIRLGLPSGSTVSATTGSNVKLKTGSSISFDALSGRVSAYVRVGVPPLSATYEATLFAWDGLHEQTKLWGSEVTAPMKLMTWAAQSDVQAGQIVCIDKRNTTGGVPADRTKCLKPVHQANACIPYPAATYCDSAIKPYQLRGPTGTP